MSGQALAEAARRLVGARFALHGRDPALGLDCVGVLAAALEHCGFRARWPAHYTLRGTHEASIADVLAQLPLKRIEPQRSSPGDVLLLRPAPCQLHLAIATAPVRIVHAHLGLRRVVEAALPTQWPLLGQFRIAS